MARCVSPIRARGTCDWSWLLEHDRHRATTNRNRTHTGRARRRARSAATRIAARVAPAQRRAVPGAVRDHRDDTVSVRAGPGSRAALARQRRGAAGDGTAGDAADTRVDVPRRPGGRLAGTDAARAATAGAAGGGAHGRLLAHHHAAADRGRAAAGPAAAPAAGCPSGAAGRAAAGHAAAGAARRGAGSVDGRHASLGYTSRIDVVAAGGAGGDLRGRRGRRRAIGTAALRAVVVAGRSAGAGAGVGSPGLRRRTAHRGRIVKIIPLWLHKLSSPPAFYRFAGALRPWLFWGALILGTIGLYGGLVLAPGDYQQGDAYRIIFIHVPCAWMGLFAYGCMAVAALVALV